MSTIVTRAGKGSALTFAEVDSNFTNLNTDKYQAGDAASLASLTLSAALTTSSGGTGTSTAFTAGSVIFAGAIGVYSQDNAQFFWDNTNNRLGIGNATPTVTLDVTGAAAFSTSATTPIVIGGTGTTSTLSLRPTSGVGATGADIVFQVGTNGATEAMRVLNSGNVGIGTVSPQSKLHVSGTGIFETAAGSQVYLVEGTSPSLILHNDGTNTFFLHTASGDPYGTWNANRPLTINNASGNVTLAQTTQFTAAYSATTGSAQIYMNAATGNRIDYNNQGVNVPTFTTRSAGTKVVWYPTVGATTVDYATGINSFTLWNSVPQNTSAFFFKWYGGTTEVASLTGVGDFTIAGDVYTALGSAAAPSYSFSGDANTGIWSPGADTIAASTAGSERLRLGSTGNLLIGTTAALNAGAERMTVAGNTLTDASGTYPVTAVFADTRAYNSTTPPAGGGIGFGFKYNVAGDLTVGSSIQGYKENTTDLDYGAGLRILTRTNGTQPAERMRIDSTGNVGIGATNLNAANKLTVNGNAVLLANGEMKFADANNQAVATIKNSGAATVSQLEFLTGSTPLERMRIDSSGNVGIGATANLSTLTVNGSFASKSPSTVNAATYTVAATDGSLRFTTTNCTVTLPAAASFPGRILYLNNITANSVTSASSNVIPLGSNTAGTAILAATAGKFAMLQSDGTNWITMMSN